MAKPMKIDPVSSATVAEAFGISERRVRQLAEEGIIPSTKYKNLRRYDLIAVTRAYIDYLKEKAGEEETKRPDSEQRKAEADADYKRAKADQAELELAELEGRMHRSEDVKEAVGQLVSAVRSGLIALPGRCAVDAFSAGSAEEVSEVIRREAFAVLEDLSNFAYDPQVYQDMVRKRQGWTENGDRAR